MTGSQTVVAQREAGQAWSGHQEAEGTAQGRAHRACAPAPRPHARLSAEMEAGPWVRSQLFLGSVTLAAAGDPPRPPDLDKQQTPTLGTSRLGLLSPCIRWGICPPDPQAAACELAPNQPIPLLSVVAPAWFTAGVAPVLIFYISIFKLDRVQNHLSRGTRISNSHVPSTHRLCQGPRAAPDTGPSQTRRLLGVGDAAAGKGCQEVTQPKAALGLQDGAQASRLCCRGHVERQVQGRTDSSPWAFDALTLACPPTPVEAQMQRATATGIVRAVERPQAPGGEGTGRARWASGQRVQRPVPRTLDPSPGSPAQRITAPNGRQHALWPCSSGCRPLVKPTRP